MSAVEQKRTLLVVLCTDLLAGREIRTCIEQATLPYGIELDYGNNPFLRSGLGDNLVDHPIDFTVHATQGSPVAGLLNPEARITPVVPCNPLRSGGLNVSVLGERESHASAMAWSIHRQFRLAGCTQLSDAGFSEMIDSVVKDEEEVARGLGDVIGAVVVRFLNPKRQMTFAELTDRLAGVRRAPQR